jgi:two-component system, chemotaxis family, response regulator Rcp1
MKAIYSRPENRNEQMASERQLEILLVEDNPLDVFLMRDAFEKNFHKTYRLLVAEDGDEAIRFLRQESGCFPSVPRPDLVLLDLNLPKVDGHSVLSAIKSDSELKRIPTVILSSSRADRDVLKAYDRHANAYLSKPANLKDYPELVKSIESFWFTFTALPSELARAACQ